MKIGYIRISTADQQFSLQKQALESNGVDNRHIFEDNCSGSLRDRPGLNKMLEFIQEGDEVIIWKLDRLGRSLSHLIEIMSTFKKKNIILKSITENIDTSTPTGNLFFHMFGMMAEYEYSLISERVKAGMLAAKKRGIRGGRPKAISDEKIEEAKKMISEGFSKVKVCRILGIGRTTLYNYL